MKTLGVLAGAFLVAGSLEALAEQPGLLHLHWAAPFFSGGGYCSEATEFVLGLARSQPELQGRLSINQHGDSANQRHVMELPLDVRAELSQLYSQAFDASKAISVCHSEPGAWVPALYSTTPCPAFGSVYNVGRTMFETDRLPEGWAERLNRMDEVWVPTEFHRAVFEGGGVEKQKLKVIGEPVDTDRFQPGTIDVDAEQRLFGQTRGDLGQPRATRFLSVFKWEYRKGWDVLLKAFVRLHEEVRRGLLGPAVPLPSLHILTRSYHSSSDFHGEISRFFKEQLACSNIDDATDLDVAGHGGGDGAHSSSVDPALPRPSPVCIVYGTRHAGGGAADAAQAQGGTVAAAAARFRAGLLRVREEHLPRVNLLPRLPEGDMPLLYRGADALVLPSRGEGWGRPHVEAMASGLPVVATNWSGPTEFMTADNSFPVNITHLRPIPAGPFAGHLMGEPDGTAVFEAMKAILVDPEGARRRGERARSTMLEKYRPDLLAQQVVAELRRISAQVATRLTRTEVVAASGEAA